MVEQQEFHPEDIDKTKVPITPIAAPDYDFDVTSYEKDSLPSGKFSIRGLMEWSFEKMTPKGKKISIKKNENTQNIKERPSITTEALPKPVEPIEPLYRFPPKGYEIHNGLLLPKKSIVERARDQLKFPWIKTIPSVTRGFAAVTLCVGTMLIYSELSSHPGIVIGIVLVALAGSVITNKN